MNAFQPTPSLGTAVSRAMDRVKDLLFRPFDLSRWLAIAVGAWLAGLGEGGGMSGANWNPGGGRGQGRGQNLRDVWDEVVTYVVENFHWLVPLVVGLVVVGIAVALVIVWLSSRGRFMFLHNVALNRDEVVRPWHDYRAHANSLFFFRVILGVVGGGIILPLVALVIWAGIDMIRQEQVLAGPMLVVVLGVGFTFVCGLVLVVIEKLTKDFVVPIMWLRTPSWRAAWSEFRGLLGAHVGGFVLYLLFHLALSMLIGIGVLVLVILTCCIAGCLLALPFVGTVLFLPVLVFLRAFPVAYLAQFGPEYDVFLRAAPAAAVPVPPVPPPTGVV